MADRYEVHSITGYPINPSAHRTSGNQKPRTSYWVADTLYGYREVPMIVKDGNKRGGHEWAVRTTSIRRVAERTCERLNAEERTNG